MIPTSYSFTRYLSAKKSVDDRALNRPVWETLIRSLASGTPERRLRILETGAGIGTMIERLVDWGIPGCFDYTAIDDRPENILTARRRLEAWAAERGFRSFQTPTGLCLEAGDRQYTIDLEAIDLFDLARRETGRRTWDLLIAHAFLDLMDLPSALPALFGLLHPGGRFYFTINFDGATLLEPAFDREFDDLLATVYHKTMDERVTGGRPSGDSRAGRHLFAQLEQSGARVLAAGASDWVVFPVEGTYPADEAYFLHFIVHTIHTALDGRPELESERLASWAAARHAQIERGELVYIAHQLDFYGIWPEK